LDAKQRTGGNEGVDIIGLKVKMSGEDLIFVLVGELIYLQRNGARLGQ
jgi:hypothetical protein